MNREDFRSNNIRKLRLAFLLTPSELARLMRAEVADIERIESPGFPLADEWVRSVSRALGVDAAVVTAPAVDATAAKDSSKGLAGQPDTCPIAARYAIIAILAKFGGSKFLGKTTPDDISRLVQNFFDFVESDTAANDESKINRRKLALQITVLAFLQSRDFAPGPSFETDLEEAISGALALMARFSKIGREPAEQ